MAKDKKLIEKIEEIRQAAFTINGLEPTDTTVASYCYGVIDLANWLLVRELKLLENWKKEGAR